MSALRGRQPARRGPAPRRGRRPREVPGRGLQPDWPWFDGNVLDWQMARSHIDGSDNLSMSATLAI